jgi:hypothetical protein
MTMVGACGGSSQNPPGSNTGQLDCLVRLDSYCCNNSEEPTCIPTFAAAQQCSSWAAETKVTVFATPCQGLTAVRVLASYSTFYVYDSTGALQAVGDDAADPSGDSAECGAGPSGFVLPSACVYAWSGTGGATCSSGSTAPASICQ